VAQDGEACARAGSRGGMPSWGLALGLATRQERQRRRLLCEGVYLESSTSQGTEETASTSHVQQQGPAWVPFAARFVTGVQHSRSAASWRQHRLLSAWPAAAQVHRVPAELQLAEAALAALEGGLPALALATSRLVTTSETCLLALQDLTASVDVSGASHLEQLIERLRSGTAPQLPTELHLEFLPDMVDGVIQAYQDVQLCVSRAIQSRYSSGGFAAQGRRSPHGGAAGRGLRTMDSVTDVLTSAQLLELEDWVHEMSVTAGLATSVVNDLLKLDILSVEEQGQEARKALWPALQRVAASRPDVLEGLVQRLGVQASRLEEALMAEIFAEAYAVEHAGELVSELFERRRLLPSSFRLALQELPVLLFDAAPSVDDPAREQLSVEPTELSSATGDTNAWLANAREALQAAWHITVMRCSAAWQRAQEGKIGAVISAALRAAHGEGGGWLRRLGADQAPHWQRPPGAGPDDAAAVELASALTPEVIFYVLENLRPGTLYLHRSSWHVLLFRCLDRERFGRKADSNVPLFLLILALLGLLLALPACPGLPLPLGPCVAAGRAYLEAASCSPHARDEVGGWWQARNWKWPLPC
jgi:hypothetical protein